MTDLAGRAPAKRQEFYRLGWAGLGWEPVADLGWIVTLTDPTGPGGESSLISHDESASVLPAVSVEVDDVDARVRRVFDRAPEGTSSTC